MKKLFFAAVIALMAGLGQTTTAQGLTWESDRTHSSVLFSVRHILTPLYGQFREFDVQLIWDANDPSKSSVSAKVNPKSVSTQSEDLNAHLASPDFFDAEAHGEWTFQSTSIAKKGDGFVATGNLKVHGIEKVMEVPFQFLGMQDMGKHGKVAGVVAEFSILRSDFKIAKPSETIGDEVKIIVNLELEGK